MVDANKCKFHRNEVLTKMYKQGVSVIIALGTS